MGDKSTDVSLISGGQTELIISDEAYTETLIFWSCLWIIICSFGIWSNAIIIRTFARMGLDDSITISCFALGISDFGQVFSPVALIVVTILIYVEARFDVYFKIQPNIPSAYITTLTGMFSILTTFITTFLAIQRSLCIIKPLHFKFMFSKTLTWCLMVVFSLFTSVFFISYASTFGSLHILNPYTNRSYYILIAQPDYRYVDEYVGSLTTIVIPIVSQCIVVISVIVMIYGLNASLQFRQNMTVAYTPETKGTMEETGINQNTPASAKQGFKERMATVQVVLLSSIFIITSFPKILHSFAILFVPGYGIAGIYENVFKIGLCVRFTFDFINSSVNFFIYNKYNSRFKKYCFAEKGNKTR